MRPWDERSADLYEAVFAVDDHDSQVRYLTHLVDDLAPHARALLDVACGTGWHLERFRERFDVAGTDRSEAMLAHARRRLPDTELLAADMREFAFGRSFDVVTCLSSSIAWMPDLEGLERAVANMARHTNPGGVVIVEPWKDPVDEPLGQLPWTRTVHADDRIICLLETTTLRGHRWHEETHYLIGSSDGVDHVVERAAFSAFTKRDLRQAFERADLKATYDPVGPLGRGLWIGKQPAGAGGN
jgi:SAM-dependent methyltransferase